jgi:hypothetical protein
VSRKRSRSRPAEQSKTAEPPAGGSAVRSLVTGNASWLDPWLAWLSHPAAAVILGGLALACCIGMTALSWSAAPDREKVVPFLAIYALLFGLFALGYRWLRSRPDARKPALIFIAAVALRLCLLPSPPLLDDDIYRYRWDGRLLAQGVNPYADPPLAPHLDRFRAGDPLADRVAFQEVPTVYPPLSQLLFAAGHALSPSTIFGIKALIVAADMAAVWLVVLLVLRLGVPAERAALYAWNPLILKEFANTGHHDAAGIALLAGGLLLLLKRAGPPSNTAAPSWQSAAAAALLAGAALVKPVILLLAPAFWTRLRLRDIALATVLLVGAYLPFAGIGVRRLFEGVRLYALHWEMNDSLFAVLQEVFGGPVVPPNGLPDTPGTNPTARMVVLLLWAVAAAWVGWRAWRARQEGAETDIEMLRRTAVLLGVVLLLTPTMDPWYLCWLVPFLCVLAWPEWMLLTWSVGFYYLVFLRDFWEPADRWWLRAAVYAPFVAAAVWRLHRWTTRQAD